MKLRMREALVVTESEYRANLNGLNMFFGAVLGFVIAGIERLDTIEFSWILVAVTGVVVSILYVSASKQRIAYGLTTLMLILFLPLFAGVFLDEGEAIPNKLQPTLAVWAILTLSIEFLPRRPDEAHLPSA